MLEFMFYNVLVNDENDDVDIQWFGGCTWGST